MRIEIWQLQIRQQYRHKTAFLCHADLRMHEYAIRIDKRTGMFPRCTPSNLHTDQVDDTFGIFG